MTLSGSGEAILEDVLYHKGSSGSWTMRRVRLLPGEEKLELDGEGGRELCVVLKDGFRVHVVGTGSSERWAFNVVGRRGELTLAAGSLEARDKWMCRLEGLASCRRVTSTRLSSPRHFLDGRRSARVDGVFGSYLYHKKGAWRWSRRYYLLLAERGEIRCFRKALDESQRADLAATGRPPADCVLVLDLQSATLAPTRQKRFVLRAGDLKLTLDARAPDLGQAWIRKLTAAIDLAKRRDREERDFQAAVSLSRDNSAAEARADVDDDDLRKAIELSLALDDDPALEDGPTQFVATRRQARRRPVHHADPAPLSQEAKQRLINLKVTSAGGTVLALALPPTATFHALKLKIHDNNPTYPPHRIKLLFQGRNVGDDDAKFLADADVRDGANLFLVLRR
mmetsp:Transcript_11705/g.37256  ORF Transcript_11705/g.37256 Transcript_11705/m.37256 type:complete len:396 (-) Transcript_11705:326-1513(-)